VVKKPQDIISKMIQWLLFKSYTLGIYIGNLYIFFGSFFSVKLKKLYVGRRETLKAIHKGEDKFKNVIWVHCASLGEFEQGRPIIESLKVRYPNRQVVLSFFSPSGYEIRKTYEFADYIFYLPSDLPDTAISLIRYFDPEIFILVKYEFWWNLLNTLSRTECKIYLVSGVFREGDYFLFSFFTPFKNILKCFNCIFLQDELSARVLKNNKIDQTQIVGDTRIDRVISNAANVNVPDKIMQYTDGFTTIVYGSIWISDLAILRGMIEKFPHFRHIVAPHDISISNIKSISNQFSIKPCLYSKDEIHSQVLIIDNIGMLSSLYKIAKYAYIGGGFQSGIHNILEPAVFNIPVFFGPNYKKFNEAVDLNGQGAAFAINTIDMMAKKIEIFEENEVELEMIREKIKNYFHQNKGATSKIIAHLSRLF
jgi:3-deoxy-D-manno-octulosonic-acid transferase